MAPCWCTTSKGLPTGPTRPGVAPSSYCSSANMMLLLLRWPWWHEKLPASNVSTRHRTPAHQQPPPGDTRPRQPHGGRLVRPASAHSSRKAKRASKAWPLFSGGAPTAPGGRDLELVSFNSSAVKICPGSNLNLRGFDLGGSNSVGVVTFPQSPPIVISLCGRKFPA